MSPESPFAAPVSSGLRSAGVAFATDGDQLRIPARHPDVGDLLITFDDGEITVFVGNLTHLHFTPHSGSTTYAASTAEDCASDAVEYVRGVLNDEWILWAYPGGAGGSYRVGADNDPMEDTPCEGVVRYLWSGPVDARPNQPMESTR